MSASNSYSKKLSQTEPRPRNISEFKIGDLVTRVEPAITNGGARDGSYIGYPFIYKGKKDGMLVFELGKTNIDTWLKEGQEVTFHDAPWWQQGWDYAPSEEDLNKEEKREYKSTLKNTNLTAFLGRSK